MDITIQITVLALNLHFQHDTNKYTGEPSAPFQRAEIFGLEASLRFFIYFVFAHGFGL
jgi:hypothetical protein